MKKIFLCLCLFLIPLFAQWQMFSDKSDTYIYNTQTGEVYIRYKRNKKNYEDIFVKMPKGVIPKNQQNILPEKDSDKNNDSAMEAIKKANDMINHSINSGM